MYPFKSTYRLRIPGILLLRTSDKMALSIKVARVRKNANIEDRAGKGSGSEKNVLHQLEEEQPRHLGKLDERVFHWDRVGCRDGNVILLRIVSVGDDEKVQWTYKVSTDSRKVLHDRNANAFQMHTRTNTAGCRHK